MRDAEVVKRERATKLLVKANGSIDFAGDGFQCIGGTGRRHLEPGLGRETFRGRDMQVRILLPRGVYDAGEQGLFELPVGVDLDGAVFGRDGGDGVLAEVKAGLRCGKGRFPMCSAEFAVVVLLGFVARGNQAKTLRPAHGQLVKGKLGSISEMGIPALARADEENVIANVFDDVAAITKADRKSVARPRRVRKENAKSVVAARAKFLFGNALVLKVGERLAGGQGNAFDFEDTGELNEHNAFPAAEGAKIDGCVADEGIVVMDSRVDVIAEGFERETRRREAREGVRTPDVKVAGLIYRAWLTKHEILAAHLIDENVEGAGDDAVSGDVEKMPRRGGKCLDKDAQRVGRIEARDLGKPEVGERRVEGGLKAGTVQLRVEVLGRVVGETDVDGNELLVENGRAEKAGHLLLFDGIPRESKGVAESGEDHAGDAAVKRLVKGELSLFEGEDDVRLTELNAVRGGDGVNLMRVEAEGVESRQKIARRRAGCRTRGGQVEKTSKEGQDGTHTRSVVTFGMREQGEERARNGRFRLKG